MPRTDIEKFFTRVGDQGTIASAGLRSQLVKCPHCGSTYKMEYRDGFLGGNKRCMICGNVACFRTAKGEGVSCENRTPS